MNNNTAGIGLAMALAMVMTLALMLLLSTPHAQADVGEDDQTAQSTSYVAVEFSDGSRSGRSITW